MTTFSDQGPKDPTRSETARPSPGPGAYQDTAIANDPDMANTRDNPKASTVAIITGASKGLGHALALSFMASDAHLIIISRRYSDALARRAHETGCRLQQLQMDLGDPANATNGLRHLAQALSHTNAQRYVLINNAATVTPVSSASRLIEPGQILTAFNLNVISVMTLTATFLQTTQDRGADRRVLNISSGAGRSATPGWGVYCATKAALDRYTQVLAAEQSDLRVVSLAPGVIDTDMQEQIRATAVQDFPQLSRFVSMHEHGQLSSPAAVAAQIIRYIERDDFGAQVLDDIRNYA